MKRVIPTAFPADPCLDDPATLGAAIRAARTQAGLRQVDAALSIGVALQTLIDIETGQPGVSIGKILQVAQGLGSRYSSCHSRNAIMHAGVWLICTHPPL